MNNDEIFDEFDLDDDDEMETLNIIDDETGEEIELLVINKLKHNNFMYYLVLDAELADDEEEEPEASILKEVPDGAGDFFYEPVFDDNEFEAVAELFRNNSGEDYNIED